jgi:hypothetical protein
VLFTLPGLAAEPSPDPEPPILPPSTPRTRSRAAREPRATGKRAKLQRSSARPRTRATVEHAPACHAADVPLEAPRVLGVAARVLAEGAPAVAAQLVAALGPLDALRCARELVEVLPLVGASGEQTEALLSLVAESESAARSAAIVNVPPEQVSQVESTTWNESRSCFTRMRRE